MTAIESEQRKRVLFATLDARFGERFSLAQALREQHANTLTWLKREPPDAVLRAQHAAHRHRQASTQIGPGVEGASSRPALGNRFQIDDGRPFQPSVADDGEAGIADAGGQHLAAPVHEPRVDFRFREGGSLRSGGIAASAPDAPLRHDRHLPGERVSLLFRYVRRLEGTEPRSGEQQQNRQNATRGH